MRRVSDRPCRFTPVDIMAQKRMQYEYKPKHGMAELSRAWWTAHQRHRHRAGKSIAAIVTEANLKARLRIASLRPTIYHPLF